MEQTAALNSALRIFLRVIAQRLLRHCPGVATLDKASVHIGAVAFIHRFGSSLNTHVHFHVCVVDGVFEALGGGKQADLVLSPLQLIERIAALVPPPRTHRHPDATYRSGTRATAVG